MTATKLAYSYKNLTTEQRLGAQHTENFADYKLCAPHVCCGWMDMHDDTNSGVTAENPFFRIQPLFWDADAALVITDDDDEFVMVERTADVIEFNGTKLHGLVPRIVATELVSRQDLLGPAYQTFESMVSCGLFAPRMVWDWVDEAGAVTSYAA